MADTQSLLQTGHPKPAKCYHPFFFALTIPMTIIFTYPPLSPGDHCYVCHQTANNPQDKTKHKHEHILLFIPHVYFLRHYHY